PEAEAPLKIVAEVSKDAGATFMLADYYTSAGRTAEATAILAGLAKNDLTFSDAKLRLAWIAYGAKRHDEAFDLIAEVRKKQPRNAAAAVHESRMLAADGKIDDALARAKEGVSLDPRS